MSTNPSPAPAASPAAEAAIPRNLADEARELVPVLAGWRHELHRIPELSLDLPETSAFVQARLTEMGIPFSTLVGGSCVVALLGRGAHNGADAAGPCILLRADMDALPVAEESGEPFASTNGRMHACGHDLHATALLGAARILKAHEDELARLGGTVKLVFQPGEETFLGARAAIEEGLLEEPHVDAAFAAHVIAAMPQGAIAFGTHALSGVYGFRITLEGKGGHGSSPEVCIDPITAGVHVHLSLQELLAREVGAKSEVALTIGRFSGGAAANVIPDSCVLEGTMRAFDPDLMGRLVERIGELVRGVATTYRTKATVETLNDVPPLVLDEDMVSACRGYVAAALPEQRQVGGAHNMASEDFSLISERVPSAYFMVGAGPADPAERYPQHNPKIRFADEALPVQATAYAAVALGWLADHAAGGEAGSAARDGAGHATYEG